VCENGEAPLNQPVAAVCVKQAVIPRPPAFQTGGRGYQFRLPPFPVLANTLKQRFCSVSVNCRIGTSETLMIQESLRNDVFLVSCGRSSLANLFVSMYWLKSLNLRVTLNESSLTGSMIQIYLGLKVFINLLLCRHSISIQLLHQTKIDKI